MVTKVEKIVEKYKIHKKDTGSPDVQVALLTQRITNLTGHLKIHKKDFHSRRGLILMVGKRRKLLKYLLRKNLKRYEKVVNGLKLRK